MDFPATTKVLEETREERYVAYGLLCVAALIVLAVYLPLLDADFFYDEQRHIVRNPAVAGEQLSDVWSLNFWGQDKGPDTNWAYRPVTSLLNRFIHQAWNAPAAMRLVSIALHLALGLLLFRLFRPIIGPFGSALTVALFWLHPIQTETVFFAVGHAEMLGLAAVLWVWYAHTRGHRVSAWLGFALGMFAKESVVLVYPVVALHAILTKRWNTPKKFVVESVPYGVLAVFNLFIHYIVTGKWSYYVDALTNPLVGESFFVRLMHLAAMPGWYLFHLLFPVGIPADYSAGAYVPSSTAWTSLAGGVAATMALVWLMLRFRKYSGVLRFISVGIGLYFVLGLMAFQWLGLGTFVLPDRLMYVPMVGVMLALSAFVVMLAKKLVGRGWSESLVYGLCGVITIAAAVGFLPKTASAYASPRHLGESWLKNSPGGARAYFMLANDACDRKDFVAARQYFENAVSRYEDYPEARNGLAKTLSELGENERARRLFEDVVRNHPDYEDGVYSYGAFLWKIGQLDEALEVFSKASQRWPLSYRTTVEHGRLLDAMGRPEEGLAVIENACSLVNWHPKCLKEAVETRQNLFMKLFRQKRFDDIEKELSRPDATPLAPEILEVVRKKLVQGREWEKRAVPENAQ